MINNPKYGICFLLVFTVHFAIAQIQKSTFEYAVVENEKLYLDVYKNQAAIDNKQPVLIWMHGGGFSVGARDNDVDVRFMKEVAERGYTAVSISYRLLRKDTETGFGCDCPAEIKRQVFREAAKDFWKAVAYVYQNAKKLKIDTTNIIVGGSSAGAEGVMNAIYLRDWVFEYTNSKEFRDIDSIPIAGVLSFAGAVVDQRYINEDTAVPGLFYHGIKDNLVPYGTAPHHYCSPERAGYIWLDGAFSVHQKLNELQTPNVLVTYTEGKHEISGVPFNDLDLLFKWMNRLFIEKEVIQAHLIKENKIE